MAANGGRGASKRSPIQEFPLPPSISQALALRLSKESMKAAFRSFNKVEFQMSCILNRKKVEIRENYEAVNTFEEARQMKLDTSSFLADAYGKFTLTADNVRTTIKKPSEGNDVDSPREEEMDTLYLSSMRSLLRTQWFGLKKIGRINLALVAAAWRMVFLAQGKIEESLKALDVLHVNWLTVFIMCKPRTTVLFIFYMFIEAVIKAIGYMFPTAKFMAPWKGEPVQGFLQFCLQQLNFDLTGIVLCRSTTEYIFKEYFYYKWDPNEPEWQPGFPQPLPYMTTNFSPGVVKAQGLPKLRTKMDPGRSVKTRALLQHNIEDLNKSSDDPDENGGSAGNIPFPLPVQNRERMFSLGGGGSRKTSFTSLGDLRKQSIVGDPRKQSLGGASLTSDISTSESFQRPRRREIDMNEFWNPWGEDETDYYSQLKRRGGQENWQSLGGSV